ncbi:hypothetical protein RND81_14G023000 [Saponaria officinalis]|uniref:F-box domain-containing protein n=1 Tax=Saponaria officinalis TaxID=3572 RepID=A0AAW1GKX1_SAPOF
MNCDIQSSIIDTATRLPDHLILEHILPKLPVRSLLRFKSVCKKWFDTICSHHFIKSHLHYFSSALPRRLILLVNDYERYKYVFYLLCDDKRKTKLQELVVPSNFDKSLRGNVAIVGSCDGLVCLYHELNHRRTFYLWNPATRECREIDQIEEIEEIDPFMFTAAYGFGYGSFIDDYRIIAIFTAYTDEFRSQLYIYSTKSGKWKRVICVLDNYRVSTIGIHKGVTVNDRIYWPLRCRNHGEQFNSIVGFDLVSEQLELNPWMSWLLQENEADLPLFEIKDCLSLCRYKDDSGFDVWKLKKREDWNSWEKVFGFNVGCVNFVHFSTSGKCLTQHLKQLKVVDQGREESTDLGEHYNGHLWEVEDYLESFVSPF